MKNLFILIAFVGISFIATAQDSNDVTEKHMTFKGISFNMELNDFITKLKAQGFVYKKEVKSDFILMEGQFINQKCEIFIMSTSKTKHIAKVVVYLGTPQDSWSSLKSSYNDIKNLFIKKYGEPKHYEFFSKPYYEGDGYETQAIKKEKCTYISFFTTPSGAITVEISKYCQMKIVYEDSLNMDIIEQETEKSALEEI